MKSKNHSLLAGAFFITLLTGALLTGCKKTNDNNSPASVNHVDIFNGASEFTANFNTPGIPIGPESFQSRSSRSVYYTPNHYWDLEGYVQLPNRDTLVMFIELYSEADFTVGQAFDFSDRVASAEYYDFHFNMDYYVGAGAPISHGSITLTTLDTVGHKIAGIFNGVMQNMNGGSAPDSLVVTNGTFNTTYTIVE